MFRQTLLSNSREARELLYHPLWIRSRLGICPSWGTLVCWWCFACSGAVDSQSSSEPNPANFLYCLGSSAQSTIGVSWLWFGTLYGWSNWRICLYGLAAPFPSKHLFSKIASEDRSMAPSSCWIHSKMWWWSIHVDRVLLWTHFQNLQKVWVDWAFLKPMSHGYYGCGKTT